MTAEITINGKTYEVESGVTIADAVRGTGNNPSSFLFAVDGNPVPMDSPIQDDWLIKAIKVASGG